MTQLRHDHPVLVYGSYTLLLEDDPQVYAYLREYEDERMLVVLNFSAKPASVVLDQLTADLVPAINNYPELELGDGSMQLAAYQAVVLPLP